MSVFFGNEVSVSNKISAYIRFATKGNDMPTEVWLTKNDYLLLYKELQAIQRIRVGHSVLPVPEKHVMAGHRAVWFDGVAVIYNPSAKPLPAGLTDMKDWENIPLKDEENENT
jgi:hypothetical protein